MAQTGCCQTRAAQAKPLQSEHRLSNVIHNLLLVVLGLPKLKVTNEGGMVVSAFCCQFGFFSFLLSISGRVAAGK